MKPCPRCATSIPGIYLLCRTCWPACPAELRAAWDRAVDKTAKRQAARGILDWAKASVPVAALEARLRAAPDFLCRPTVTLEALPFDGEPPPLSPAQIALMAAGWSHLRDLFAERQPGQAALIAEFTPGSVRVLWADPATLIAMMADQDGTPPAPALAEVCPPRLVPVCVLQVDRYATCRLSLDAWKKGGAA